MNDEDDLSKTMVIPNPGGRRLQSAAGEFSGSPNETADSSLDKTQILGSAGEAVNRAAGVTLTSGHGENQLLVNARDIVNLAANLRSLTLGSTLAQLRMDVERLFNELDKNLIKRGVNNEVAITARYLLCCLVDELVLSTPWGAEGFWSQQTLLSKYHNETSGGQKFFLIVDRLLQQPSSNIDLIELCYVCISLGFRGKYRISQTGENEILHILNRLYQPILLQRPETRDLSPDWQATDINYAEQKGRFPASFLVTSLLFVCVAVYVFFVASLNMLSAPVLSKLESIGWNNVASRAMPQGNFVSETVIEQLQTALAESIAKGQLEVAQSNSMVTVRLVSPQLFPPGSTEVNEAVLPNVQVLVDAILEHADSVLIVGHTDSTGQAESNWVISRKRAEAVQRWLLSAHPTIRFSTTQGVADTQPLVSDISASQNRRVEVILLPKEAS